MKENKWFLNVLKKIIRLFPKSIRCSVKLYMEYIDAVFFHILSVFRKNHSFCTETTLRCSSDRFSINYQYGILGKNIPVCCASHLVELTYFIDFVLRKNNLNYFIFYGTYLGAERHHGGIIPWDTDVDIAINNLDVDEIYSLMMIYLRKYNRSYILKRDTEEPIRLFFSASNTLHVDFFAYKEVDNNLYFPDMVCSKDDIFPLRELQFYDKKLFAPKTQTPLFIYYGNNWQSTSYKQWALFKNCKKQENFQRAEIDTDMINEICE